MRFEHHLDINAPAATVFALNTDIEAWPRLTPTVTSVRRLDDGPLRPGSQALVKQPGQRATVWTVTTFDPDHSFVWHAKVMGVKTVATHVVNPTPTGCRNSLILEMTGRGSRVFGGLLGRKLRKVLRTENEGFHREALRRSRADESPVVG